MSRGDEAEEVELDLASNLDAVPPFPVLSLEVRESESGGGEVWLDGELIATASDVSDRSLFAAGKKAAGERAARRAGGVRAVRVLAVLPDGSRDRLVIDTDGRAFDASERSRRAGSVASRWAEFSRRERLLLVGSGVAALVAAGAIVGMAWPDGGGAVERAVVSSTSRSPRPAPTATQLPMLGPEGDVLTADWSVGPVADGAPVVVSGGRVVTVADGGAVIGVDPETSGRVWSTGLGEDPQELRAGQYGGRPAVFAITSTKAAVVSASSGEQVWSHDLGDGERAVMTAQGPLVLRDEVTALARAKSGEWVERVVPPAAEPVAVDGTDVLSVSDSGHWWKVSSATVPPAAQRFPSPQKGAKPRGVLTTTSSFLLFAWSGKGGKQLVQQFSWSDLTTPIRVLTAGEGGEGKPSEEAARVAPSGEWMVVDRDVVDLKSGRVTRLPQDWSTTAVLEDRAYGEPVDGQVRIVDRLGAVTTVSADDSSSSGEERAVPLMQAGPLTLFVGGQEESRLFAVRLPALDSRSSAPPSSTPAPSTPSADPKKNPKPTKPSTTTAKPSRSGGAR